MIIIPLILPSLRLGEAPFTKGPLTLLKMSIVKKLCRIKIRSHEMICILHKMHLQDMSQPRPAPSPPPQSKKVNCLYVIKILDGEGIIVQFV